LFTEHLINYAVYVACGIGRIVFEITYTVSNEAQSGHLLTISPIASGQIVHPHKNAKVE